MGTLSQSGWHRLHGPRPAFQWGGSSDWEGLHRSEFGLQEFLLTHAKPIPHSPFEDAPNRYETNLPAAKKSWKMH
jgi:hypothetical protein